MRDPILRHEVSYTVQRNPNRGDNTFSVMRDSVVIARYIDEDAAYAVLAVLVKHRASLA